MIKKEGDRFKGNQRQERKGREVRLVHNSTSHSKAHGCQIKAKSDMEGRVWHSVQG